MDATPTQATFTTTQPSGDGADVGQVDRTVDLDVGSDELWRLVSTAEGWSRWLTDTADLDVEPGAVGDVTEGDVVRRVRVDHVQPGRRVGFTWWSDDDPSDAATVELRIEDVSVSARRLHIVERRLTQPMSHGVSLGAMRSGLSACASGEALLDHRLAWEMRVWLLGACVSAMSLR